MKATISSTSKNSLAAIILTLIFIIAIPTSGYSQLSTRRDSPLDFSTMRSTINLISPLVYSVSTKHNEKTLFTEVPLNVEEWMYNETEWAEQSIKNEAINEALYSTNETELLLETWMIEEFKVSKKEVDSKYIKQLLAPEKESELEIEGWMVDSSIWSIN